MTGNEPVNRYLGDIVRGSVWLLALPLIVSGLAAAFAWRRRDRARVAGALRFQAIVWGTVVLGFVSVARIAGPAYPYLVRWQWVLAALVWLSALWSIAASALPEPTPDPAPRGAASHAADNGPRWIVIALAAACLLASAAATVSIASADVPDAAQSDAVRALVGPALDRVRDSGPVLLDDEGSYRGEYVFGLLAELDRRGVEVWIRDGLEIKVGSRRTRQGREPATTLLVVSGNGVDAHLADGDTPLVKYDPLTKRERARFAVLDEREARNLEDLVAHRTARDPLTPAEESFMRTMRARGEQVAVFVRGE